MRPFASGGRRPPTATKVYRPSGPTLERFHNSDAFVRLIRGPVGSAKTTACIWELMKLACQQKPNAMGLRRSRWLVCRSSYPELENATLPSWFDEVPEAFGTFMWTKPYHHYVKFDDVRAEFVFMGLDEPDGPEKLKGMQFTGAWFNEIVTIPLSVFSMALGRIDRFPPKTEGGATRACVIGDTNSPEEGHWYHRFETEGVPGEYEGAGRWDFFVQPPAVVWNGQRWVPNLEAENLDNLSDGYYLNQIAGRTDDEIRVLLANEFGFTIRGEAVYPEYSDRVHTKDYEPEPGLPLAMGVDCTGLRPAAVIGQRVPSGQVRIFSEIVTNNCSMEKFAEVVNDHVAYNYPDYQFAFLTGDPRGDARQGGRRDMYNNFQILQAAGLDVVPAYTNSFDVRRSAVAHLLSRLVPGTGEPELVIHSRCHMLRKGFAGGYLYRRLRTKEDEYEQTAAKNRFADPHDALQYLVLGLGVGRTITKRPKRKGNRPPTRAVSSYDVFRHR